MPANLTPEYKDAELAYRRARDPKDRLEALREMLRTIPKHKGTEHLRADIKTKIKELREDLEAPAKVGTRGGPVTVIRPEGAAQLALLGPPNSGKSTLHDRLTGSHAPVGPYPFTTQYPQPGMMPFEDIALQLLDLPPLAKSHPVPWIGNTLYATDGALLVVDLGNPDCVAQVLEIHGLLGERKVILTGDWDAATKNGDLFTKLVPALLVANKSDTLADPVGELSVLEELTEVDYPTLAVSAETGEGTEELAAWLFEHLRIVRVYTKMPGHAPDLGRPYTLRAGDTVVDLATLVHRDIASGFRYARVWGPATFDGQQVGRDHVLADGDVVELHA
ncbi:MAG: TGS domain-containing protein [Acidimicrobiia bacterium]